MKYDTFAKFYPFYLSQHQNLICRQLHFAGSLLVLFSLFFAVILSSPWLLFFIPVGGYGMAWAGHFFFEHNKPATFTYPLYSLMADWVMFWQILTGKVLIFK